MIEIMSPTLADHLAALPCRRLRLPAGSFLFHQGDPVRSLHLVVEGDVHLVRHQRGGATLILQRAGPGALLAEASLFAARYHCAAQAAAPSEVLAIPRHALRTRLGQDRVLAAVWARHLSREVQAARERAEIIALKTVAERLDAWLATRGAALPAKGAWKSIAAEIAVSPEALYRELARRRRDAK